MKRTLAVILGLAVFVPMAADAQSDYGKDLFRRSMEEGRNELFRGRPRLAEAALRRAVSIEPNDQYARYMLANTLAKAGQHDEAIGHYRAAFELGPKTQLAEYSRMALSAYGLPSPLSRDVFNTPLPMPTDFSVPAPPVRSSFEQSVDMIDRQMSMEYARKQKFAKDLGKSAVRGGDHRAQEAKSLAEHEIANMYAGVGRTKLSSKTDLDAQATRMRKEADEKAKAEQARAKEQADAHDEWLKERQRDLNSSASSLKEQLQQKSPFGHDLDPTGTGLYVRNYKSTPGKRKLPEPRLGVVRLMDRPMRTDNPDAQKPPSP